MAAAFAICLAYALAGFLYAPGTDSLTALVFIAASASPLLLAARPSAALPALAHPAPSAGTFLLLLGLGFLNLVVIANGLDRDPADLLNPEGFVLLAAEATAKRYQDEGSSGNPVLLALSLFLVYRAGAAAQRLSRWLQLLAFAPLLLYTMLSTEKWPMFLAGAFYIGGIFAARTERAALWDLVKVVVVFGVTGFVLAAGALVLRGFDGDLIELPAQLLHYILAPFAALGHWLQGPATDHCCGGGTYTFIGLANQLGLAQREAGVFADNFVIYGQETNIYSAWRYLVQDYSITGPLAINTAVAVLCVRTADKGYATATRALKGLMVLCALLSLNVTPFVHNSVALATTLALVYTAGLAVAGRPRKTNPPHEQTRTADL